MHKYHDDRSQDRVFPSSRDEDVTWRSCNLAGLSRQDFWSVTNGNTTQRTLVALPFMLTEI